MWPKIERIKEVFKLDAVSMRTEDILCVHQSPILKRFDIDSRTYTELSENDLLNELITPNADGYRGMAIVGKSGSGKTHQIRWCHAKLQKMFLGAENPPMIIFINVNDSIKDSIGKLLDGIQQNYEWDQVKERLRQVNDGNFNVEHDVIRLCTEIGLLLEEEIKHNPGDRLHRLRLGLRALFSDLGFQTRVSNETNNHFRKLIAAHYNHHPERLNEEDFLKREDFYFQDYIPPNQILQFLYSEYSQNYHIEESKAILESVRDEALNRVFAFRFNGGIQITQLLKDIRKQLLAQGKSLYILIEDFVRMSGFQQFILDATMESATPFGERELCDMHLLIANTEGFKIDTIRTRFIEWTIEFPKGDEGDGERASDLVARYLFTSRTPVENLFDNENNPRSDKAIMNEEEWNSISCFGDINNNLLFPFSLNMINQLRRKFQLNTPRAIIQKCFVLLRDSQGDKQRFLQQLVPGLTIHPELQFQIANKPNSDLLRVITYYYGANGNQIEQRIFDYFNVVNPYQVHPPVNRNEDGEKQVHLPVNRNEDGEKQVHPPVNRNEDAPPQPEDPRIARFMEYKQVIGTWNDGEQITIGKIADIKDMIRVTLIDNTDWNSNIIKYDPDSYGTRIFEAIYIHNFNRNPPGNDSIVIISEEEFDNLDLRSTVALWLYALSYKRVFGGFDPTNPSVDGKNWFHWYKLYAEFVDFYKDKFLAVFSRLAKIETTVNEVCMLAEITGRAVRQADGLHLENLFLPAKNLIIPQRYGILQNPFSAAETAFQNRLDKLIKLFGAHQGDGGVLAVDITRMQDYYRAEAITDENLISILRQAVNININNLVRSVNQDILRVNEGFGQDDTISDIRGSVVQMVGVLGPLYNGLQVVNGHAFYLEMLNGNAVIPRPQIIDSQSSLIVKMTILAQIDLVRLERVSSFVQNFSNFYNNYLNANPLTEGQDIEIENIKDNIQEKFNLLINLIDNFGVQNDNN